MQCPDQFTWELYIDNELPPSTKEELEEHLRHCRTCSEKSAGLRREAMLMVEALAATPLPPDLADYIRGRLDPGASVDTGWLWLIIAASAAAGIFIAPASGVWSLLERLLFFIKLIGGGGLVPELLLLLAGTLRELALASLQGRLMVPALAVIVLCLLWIKLIIRRGGHAHA